MRNSTERWDRLFSQHRKCSREAISTADDRRAAGCNGGENCNGGFTTMPVLCNAVFIKDDRWLLADDNISCPRCQWNKMEGAGEFHVWHWDILRQQLNKRLLIAEWQQSPGQTLMVEFAGIVFCDKHLLIIVDKDGGARKQWGNYVWLYVLLCPGR